MVDESRQAQPDHDDDDDDDEDDASAKKQPARKPHHVYILVSLVVLGILLAVYLFNLNNQKPIPEELIPIKILIIGNDTLHFNDVPNMVREVAVMSKPWRPLEVSCVAREDYSLRQHIDEGSIQKVIDENDWDFVVLQDRWLQPLQDPAGMLESTRTIAKAARKRGSRVVLFIPWADAGLDTQQEVLSSVSRQIAQRLSLEVAPAGDIFFAVTKKHKQVYPYALDKHHVNSIGSWLAAATIYDVVTGTKAVLKVDQLTFQTGDGDEPQVPLTAGVAEDLEWIVWQAVASENKGRMLGPSIKTTVKGLDLK